VSGGSPVRAGRRLTGSGKLPVVAVAGLTCIVAAARILEPAPAVAGGYLREVGGFLAFGLLILSASRACFLVEMALRRFRPPSRRRIVSIAAGRACLEAWTAAALALPALAVGWEFGAPAASLAAVGAGGLVAGVTGGLLGAIFGLARCGAPLGAILATALGAWVLWPASLGWAAEAAPSFPTPEAWWAVLAMVLVVTVIVLSAPRPRARGA
jgi:hypothetical protein